MMPLKLKLTTGGQQPQPANGDGGSAASPLPTPSTAGGPRLKLKASQPPTPATEHVVSVADNQKPAARKATTAAAPSSKKRANNDDISPAAKRIASGASAARKPSIKLKPTLPPGYAPSTATPLSAVSSRKVALALAPPRKQSTILKALTAHHVKRDVPKRETGVGYDSEDSEREEDPAIQQGLILRMPPGKDADILRNAIADNKIGVKDEEGSVQASIKFVTADLRRALVKVEDRKYAAALVDLPCIVESMKSWDKKGWWKVSDVCQMLLVLGRVDTEAEIRSYALPKEVDKETMQYAHGLTPPMHHVRKRRFRKRVNPKQLENVEAEVERLLREDEEWERSGGKVSSREYTLAEWDVMRRTQEPGYEDGEEMDAEGEVMDSTEYAQEYAESPEEDYSALEADLNNALAEDAAAEPEPRVTELITDSPAPLLDQQAASLAAVEHAMAATSTPSAAETPIHDAPDEDEASSDDSDDDSDDDDDDDMDVVDEDAAAKTVERNQQLEEVADLEREVQAVRIKASGMANQLLKKRELEKLARLEGDLRMKRVAFGLVGGEDGEDGGGGNE
ncbi:hypothetical protein BAUCODRAFT_141786 [Baudoinia panamericana UAMH 10762]|uniref:TAFII55 protein conserved region domain-containing protein n=1 Tax=Baudoinia panamericana (strain UAMH 10762) TaxID=717646 RepID=M2LGQ5_BAUPA|nr:uncharacterized protein BAUCODRAFT_141786 [Baudoinia panamericana UAMH 10762]EMC93282.1 hypothetical protein BAUCODRAFT_141786 [Baudoinia panamericana UAMH 10762]